MERYAASLVKRYSKEPLFPMAKKMQLLLRDTSDKPLQQSDISMLGSYFLNPKCPPPTEIERKFLLHFLNTHHAYSSVTELGKRFLFVRRQGDTTDDLKNMEFTSLKPGASVRELKLFLQSMVRTGQLEYLDSFMRQIITELGTADRRPKLIKIVSALFIKLCDVAREPSSDLDITEPLIKFSRWLYWIDGTREFTNYAENKRLLGPVLSHIYITQREQSNPSLYFKRVLDGIKSTDGSDACSQFATTLIYLCNYSFSFDLVEAIWKYKLDNNLPIVSSDLTAVMHRYNKLGKYTEVPSLYEKYPAAHGDSLQFDYLLLAYSKSSNWNALKAQFDTLFGIGKLPDIHHYEITMYSLARRGKMSEVEELYAQLLRRGLRPTYSILQSLLISHYKARDFVGCFKQFDLFDRHKIEPTSYTYTIMFRVYGGLNNIDAALRFLKKMTDEKRVPVLEEHFAILIRICSKYTNYLIARELFNIMGDHYAIRPTPLSIAALMRVYTESGMWAESLKLFDTYYEQEYIKNDEHYCMLYNEKLLAHMEAKQFEQCEAILEKFNGGDITMNNESYKILLKYMVCHLRDYVGAERKLAEMLRDESITVTVDHFEILMAQYGNISYYDGVLKLYDMMREHNIPVNSKVLYHIVKATFKLQMMKKEDLSGSIAYLDKIMESAAEGTPLHPSLFHPSIMAWAMRTVAKYYSRRKALQILTRYNKLFYDKETLLANKRFVLMRSLVVLFAELGEWDEFSTLFDNIFERLESFESRPSSLVRNKKLDSLFVGIFSYKVRHLVVQNKVEELPKWLAKLESRHMVLDNKTWNDVVTVLFSNPATIRNGLRIANDKLIHGYNLIHKYRLLRKLDRDSPLNKDSSWFLQQKRANPDKFKPTLYLTPATYDHISKSLDEYMNKRATIEEKENQLREFIADYKYFMKSYLMKPRADISDWDTIEARHSPFFSQMRTTKRVVPVEEF